MKLKMTANAKSPQIKTNFHINSVDESVYQDVGDIGHPME